MEGELGDFIDFPRKIEWLLKKRKYLICLGVDRGEGRGLGLLMVYHNFS